MHFSGKAVVWNTLTGQKVREFPPNTGVNKVMFSSNGNLLLTAGRDGLQLWDIETGILKTQIEQSQGVAFYTINFSEDYIIANIPLYPLYSIINIWNINSGKHISTNKVKGTIMGISYIINQNTFKILYSNWINSVGHYNIQVNTISGENLGDSEINIFYEPYNAYNAPYIAIFSKDGTYLLTSDGSSVRLISLISGQQISSVGVYASKIAVSPDMKYLVIANEKELRLYSTTISP